MSEHTKPPDGVSGTFTLRLNLDGPVGVLQRALRRSMDLVAFGLAAADSMSIEDERPPLPDAFPEISFGEPMPVAELRDEFKAWTLAGGLRECIEGVELFLQEVHLLCLAHRLFQPSARVVQGSEIHRLLEQLDLDKVTFSTLNVAKKLKELTAARPGLIEKERRKAIFTLNSLRNCLVHRRGIVQAGDCGKDGTLRVRWRKVEALIQADDGTEQPVPGPGTVVEKEGHFALRFRFEERVFQMGERVSVTAQEFQSIAWTVFEFALDTRANFERILTAEGVAVEKAGGPASGTS